MRAAPTVDRRPHRLRLLEGLAPGCGTRGRHRHASASLIAGEGDAVGARDAPAGDASEVDDDAGKLAPPAETPASEGTVPGVLRVVVVDDDLAIRTLVGHLCDRNGVFELVGETPDGHDAVTLVREIRPDIVLLDLLMPDVDGREVLPGLVRSAPEAMVVVLSALSGDEHAGPVLAAGAFAYLEKSVLGARLCDELAQLYGMFQQTLHGGTVWPPSARIRS